MFNTPVHCSYENIYAREMHTGGQANGPQLYEGPAQNHNAQMAPSVEYTGWSCNSHYDHGQNNSEHSNSGQKLVS